MKPSANLEVAERSIARRLEALAELPNGVIHRRPGSRHNVVVIKKGSHLEMVFGGGDANEIESEFDLNRPLCLVDGFTQALTLGLLWQPDPVAVFVLGFGGGRIPTVLHHYFPNVAFDCAEIDPDVVEVARDFFGVPDDPRLRIAIEDGRAWLARQTGACRFNFIIVDAFEGTGDTPAALSTSEFYKLCQDHLGDGGVVAVNILTGDSRLGDKVDTLVSSFPQAYGVEIPREGSVVLFGATGQQPSLRELTARAKILQLRHRFEHPFVEHAKRLVPIADVGEFVAGLQRRRELARATIGRDAASPNPAGLAIAPHHPYQEAGRNSPCPCGSGKKFKQCHGRRA